MFSAINQYSRKFNFEILRHTKPSATAIQKQYLRPPFEGMYWSGLCMQKLLPDFEVQTILYIGSGEGVHAQIFQDQGKTVTVIEYGNSIYFQKAKDTHRVIVEDFNQWKTQDKFECVWASHILKHQPNPNQFLKEYLQYSRCKWSIGNNDTAHESTISWRTPYTLESRYVVL